MRIWLVFVAVGMLFLIACGGNEPAPIPSQQTTLFNTFVNSDVRTPTQRKVKEFLEQQGCPSGAIAEFILHGTYSRDALTGTIKVGLNSDAFRKVKESSHDKLLWLVDPNSGRVSNYGNPWDCTNTKY